MTTSYIENLHLENVRQFKELNITFNKGFNFIAGPNGCGKTSILAGISHCFTHTSFQYSRFKDDSQFWVDIKVNDVKKRIGTGPNSINLAGYRKGSLKTVVKPPAAPDGREVISVNESNTKIKEFCPLFIGAHRSIKYKQINGMQRELPLDQQINQNLSSSSQSLYGEKESNIKQWFVNRYFVIDKDWAKEERDNWFHMINNLPFIGPFNSNFSYIKTEQELEPIFSIYGEECYLEELSSGFQAVLSIIANIFEWVEGTNEPGKRVAKNAEGTVLIDELDLHLHPEWQFSLREGLSRIFPSLQFIVTTHSPHLLSSAAENEVIIMQKKDDNRYTLQPSEMRFSGWNTDQILSEIMGVKSLENKVYERLVSIALLQIEEASIQGLRDAISNLVEVCHPSDSIVTVLKARLASMVALQND
ncbi:AAA family ATPase [Shewanella baltica]|uniref:AAA family ATPase n=1 Tax=Shewanella baltica TaxID=62322 RepID=UPI00217E0865|nr:AAA family ATPase [Shewanella baltica]MCS6160630.1 AAA family ATPase [Shewanella baltica]